MAIGCGGSGGGGQAIPVGDEAPPEKGTALFEVDIATGQVKVTPIQPDPKAPAVLAGNAVSFTTSTLLSEGGEVGRRAIKVQLKNNLSESIGGSRPVRVYFGVMSPALSYQQDLRSLATVSTPVSSGATGFLDGPTGSAMLSSPTAVAGGFDGAVYFNGTDNRIRRLQDGYVSTVAQNVPASGLVYMRDPVSGREYLVAPCATLHSVKLITIASGSVSNWAGLDGAIGNVNGASSASRFNAPSGTGVDSSQSQILIADLGNGAVRAISYTFTGGNLVAGTVSSRYSGLTEPVAVAVASNRSVGVVERAAHRVRIYNAGSSREAVFGGTTGNVNGDGNLARFSFPTGIATLGDTFLVTDSGNNQIRRLALKNGAAPLLASNWTVSVVAGIGTPGPNDGNGFTAQFGQLGHLATDSSSRLIAADATVNGVRRITSEGSFDFGTPDGSGTGEANLTNPTGFADLNGLQRPYIDVPGLIEPGQSVEIGQWQFSIPSEVPAFRFAVTVEAPTSVYAPLEAVLNPTWGAGSPNVVGMFLSRNSFYGAMTGPLDSVGFDNAMSFFDYDASGNLFVTDRSINVLRRIDRSGEVTFVAGQVFSSGSGNGNGANARFSYPEGIKVSADGSEVFVADEADQTIRRIALTPGTDPRKATNWQVTAIAGTSLSSGLTDGTGNVARFSSPVGLAGPSMDEFFVSDYQTHRIRLVRYIGGDRSLATSWHVRTVAGSLAGDGGRVDGVGANARFRNPLGLAWAPSGRLIIADRGNYSVRRFDPLTFAVTTAAGTGVSGTADNDVATSGTFLLPATVATDASGAIYVNDLNRVRRIYNGSLKTVAGGGDGSGTTGDKIQISPLYGMAMNPQGDVMLNTGGRLLRLTRKLGR